MSLVSGIDVGKANLDVSIAEGPVASFANNGKGMTTLLEHLRQQGAAWAVCEATGGYEQLLVDRLREAGVSVQVAHPSRVRDFARACGYGAKTDVQDAQVLARYGRMFTDWRIPNPEPEPDRQQLRDALQRRRQLVEQRTRELNRLDKGISLSVARSTKRHIAWLDKEIARLEENYREAIEGNPAFTRRAALYRTVTGIGPLTAATLIAYLPELGQRDGKALTSLVGLAPWSRDSGQKLGRRSIRGGRGVVRHALYICAWSAIRVDGQLRRFYQRLRERGKPGKVAVIAVMRKMLLQLNAVARRGTPWMPQAG